MDRIRTFRRERASDYVRILLGTLLMAASTNFFYGPARMVPGGFTGLAIILRDVGTKALHLSLPLGIWNVLLNVPMILLSIRVRGWHFMRRTFLAALAFSFWLLLVPELELVPGEYFLTSVAGGCLMGAGLGLVFLGKATTGGTDTLAALIQKMLPHLNTAQIFPVLDGAVILLSVWIFGMEISLYAVSSVILSGRIADGIIAGARNACVAYIISEKSEEISSQILQEMNRGVTMLEGTGKYTNSPRPVLFCAVSKKQAVVLRELVEEIDRNAFLILTDAHEVRGEGFLGYGHEEF